MTAQLDHRPMEPTGAPPGSRLRLVRLVVGYAAIAATLPYLSLKLLWVFGVPVGLTDPDSMNETFWVSVNALTFAMDFVAAALALTFTHDWGRRAPAWLLLLPMWMATGFLAPIVVAAPAGAVLGQLTGSGAVGEEGTLAPWVSVVVGGGFALQGVLLITAFALYAGDRWGHLAGRRSSASDPGRAVQVPLALLAGSLAVLAASLHLAVLARDLLDVGVRSGTFEAMQVVEAALCLAGVAGLHRLLRPRPGDRRWLAPVLTWVGSGSMFAWGLWTLGAVLTAPGLHGAQWVGPVGLTKMLAGLLMGVVALFVVASRDRGEQGVTA